MEKRKLRFCNIFKNRFCKNENEKTNLYFQDLKMRLVTSSKTISENKNSEIWYQNVKITEIVKKKATPLH